MELRTFGRTGLRVSALGFGCGAVGGLMVRGAPRDQERAVARALAAGINVFDTAPSYGDGRSETNLGHVLATLRPEIVLTTKVMLRREDRRSIARTVARSIDASLGRLGRDHVDVLQLHNAIGGESVEESVPADVVMDEIVPALQRVRDAGKTRFIGYTAIGETPALHRLIDSGAFDSAQVAYNLLNPSAGRPLPAGLAGPDFSQLLPRAAAAGMGTIGIRALAGGALSGTADRHPIGATDVAPIGTSGTYATDVDRAQAFRGLAGEAGVDDLVELALRFALSPGGPTTVLVGTSTLDQLEHAIAAAERGGLPASVLARLPSAWAAMPG